MEVSGQIHVPAALIQRYSPWYQLDRKLGEPSEPVWMLWRRKKSLSLTGNRILAVQLTDYLYTESVIPKDRRFNAE
jgi:hypothetical protein